MSQQRQGLSQDMLKELLQDAAGSQQEAKQQTPTGDLDLFDWSQPSHFSPRQMDRLSALFDRCAHALSERLAAEFTAELTVQLDGVRQRRYDTFALNAAKQGFLLPLHSQDGLPSGAT